MVTSSTSSTMQPSPYLPYPMPPGEVGLLELGVRPKAIGEGDRDLGDPRKPSVDRPEWG
jgi:hypothetical protein